jgi:hypothetical protein
MAREPIDPGRQELLSRLTAADVRFVVIGGAAIQTHGIDYRTEDVDLTPETSDDNLQRLADVLNDLDPLLEVDPDRPETALQLPPGYITPKFLRDAHAVNLRTSLGKVDLTLHPSGFPDGYAQLERGAQTREVAATSIAVPVARLADVEHSKRIADRPKDRAYLQSVGRLQAPEPEESAPADEQRPAYLIATLGPRPASLQAARLWDHAAQRINAYRQRWGVTDPADALGDEPTNGAQLEDHAAVQSTLRRARGMIARSVDPPGPDVGR